MDALADGMDALADPVLSVTRDYLIGIGPLIAGIVVAAMLILAVWFGFRRRREPGPPSPEEQPQPPDEPQEFEIEPREPDEMPHDGRRLMPYELHGLGTAGTRPAEAHEQERPEAAEGPAGPGEPEELAVAEGRRQPERPRKPEGRGKPGGRGRPGGRKKPGGRRRRWPIWARGGGSHGTG